MTGTLLDVSTMSFERVYTCDDGSKIDLREFLDLHYDAVQALAGSGLVKNKDSFGFAMAAPMWDEDLDVLQQRDRFWDKPDEFVWFVGGWGDERDRYIANAIRKLRALLRPHKLIEGWNPLGVTSTLEMRFDLPGLFRDKVDQQNPDGTFPWGDFPWGGGVKVHMGPLTLAGAVSCLSEIEDDMVARLILGGVGQRIVNGNKLLKD